MSVPMTKLPSPFCPRWPQLQDRAPVPMGRSLLLSPCRSSSLWPDSSKTIRLTGYRTVSTLVQVRILTAEVFWNFRNLLGERYVQIPGYRLPRLTNIYGLRWEFWN